MSELAGLQRFVGKVAVVTGAAQGIGAAIACRFLAEGASVILLDRRAIGEDFFPPPMGRHQLDVCDEGAVQRAVDGIVAQFGRIDIWVNNAGIYQSAPLHETDLNDWQKALNVNLTGTFICTRSVASIMMRQGGGRIINVASLAGVIGFPHSAAYCATKAGVLGLTRTTALDLGPYGITVNAICPGTLLTEMGYQVDAMICRENGWEPGTFLKMRAAELPMRRLGTPDDVAGAAAFLASDDAAWITGQSIVLDGGQFPF